MSRKQQAEQLGKKLFMLLFDVFPGILENVMGLVRKGVLSYHNARVYKKKKVFKFISIAGMINRRSATFGLSCRK